MLFFLPKGDDYDSSDDEWETHIGRNARAFLGLAEPVVEIPVDGGVGIARMVRDALQRVDDIHLAAMDVEGVGPISLNDRNDLSEVDSLIHAEEPMDLSADNANST